MSEERLSPTQIRNLLSHEILAKPAPAARVAALPAVSDYAKREGLEPKKVRIPLVARLMA